MAIKPSKTGVLSSRRPFSSAYGFWARTAIIALAIWPPSMACAVVYGDLLPSVAVLTATLALGFLFLVAGLLSGLAPFRSTFTLWQMSLMALVLCSFVVSTAFVALKPATSIWYGLFDVVLMLGGIGAFLLIRNAGEHVICRLLQAMLLSGAFYLALYVWAFDDFVQRANGKVVHSFYPFVNIRRFTNVLAPLTAVALVLWSVSAREHRGWTWFYGCAATFFVSFLIWSGGRAPTMSVLIAVLSLSLCVAREVRLRLLMVLLITFAVGTVVSQWLPIPDGSFGFWFRVLSDEKISSASSFTSNRLWLWEQTLWMITDHPWFGHGYEQWNYHNPEFVNHGSAHNFPLQIVSDLGLIGGGAALVLAFGTWIGHLRHVGSGSPTFLVAVSGLSVMMIQSLVDGIFSGRPSLQLVFFLFALCAAARPPYATRPTAPPV